MSTIDSYGDAYVASVDDVGPDQPPDDGRLIEQTIAGDDPHPLPPTIMPGDSPLQLVPMSTIDPDVDAYVASVDDVGPDQLPNDGRIEVQIIACDVPHPLPPTVMSGDSPLQLVPMSTMGTTTYTPLPLTSPIYCQLTSVRPIM